ncbi:MAG: hypothetical protein BJ554DRAFT_4668 [Olpidium bornovanus]|uniref:Uncharacterized protein n=1 Tax=Olpidium bornovanus TaxID=278681 RepID=A0A8H8DLB6_9FUNG|nr:MAG: hypothetical protein BJ554DRAFT_4668 [Olpidium bornovanus]
MFAISSAAVFAVTGCELAKGCCARAGQSRRWPTSGTCDVGDQSADVNFAKSFIRENARVTILLSGGDDLRRTTMGFCTDWTSGAVMPCSIDLVASA